MKYKWFLRSFRLASLLFTLLCCSVSGSLAEELAPGSQLPQVTLPAPDSPQTQNYLGLKAMGPFSVSDVRSKVLIIEFLSST
jgi:hypothetical protein